jgi:putative serine protease PepD
MFMRRFWILYVLIIFSVGISGASEKPVNESKNALVTIKEADEDVMKGSGFLYSSEGYIITNNHVVMSENGSEEDLEVKFNLSGEWIETRTIGRDPETDLAILKLERLPAGVESLQISDKTLREGQNVKVFGRSPKQGEKVVEGEIVDASEDMETREGITLEDAIVISAPIALGNSGGPVLISEGKVVGVISARNKVEGFGFAVPASSVLDTVDRFTVNQNTKAN